MSNASPHTVQAHSGQSPSPVSGQPPGSAHGIDTDADGLGTVSEQRVHQLIRQPEPITERTFEITFLDPGLEAYSFTFG